MDDHELLRKYVRSQSQEAFRQLVDRHLPMVYSAACRMVQDAHLAEEVAQGVFCILAQKAGSLGDSLMLAGWLYNTTRHLAMHAVRSEQRRRQREQTALAMQSQESTHDMEQILDLLEPAMDALEEEERHALVLRYLEGRSLREVGQELRISEDAARMRVNRALESLRSLFAEQGFTVTSALLATALAASTTTAVPAGLAATISAAAVAGTAAAATTITTYATLTTMFKAKAVAALLGTAVLAGTGTYLAQQRQIERLRADNQSLLAQQQQLSIDQQTAVQAAQKAQDQLEIARKENAELLRLRNEVSQLRREREAQKLRASQTIASSPHSPEQNVSNRGRYIAMEQLAFAGYATPEAALESMTWTMVNGTYEQSLEVLFPERQEHEANDVGNRRDFEKARETFSSFKGIQIVARKNLGKDRVELKLKIDAEALQTPPFTIEPMVKVGNEWKHSGSSRAYESTWDADGQVEVLAP